jgi:fermentation-respiration switch protein FrsA (DUF1100 family)
MSGLAIGEGSTPHSTDFIRVATLEELKAPGMIVVRLPLDLLITDTYSNERNIRSVTVPVLILHDERDAVIPVEMGWRVYRAANEPKRIYPPMAPGIKRAPFSLRWVARVSPRKRSCSS